MSALSSRIYAQVTNRCNMKCRHCCFACTTKGNDMSWNNFLACVEATDPTGTIVFGGGEPTLHPKIMRMIAYARKKIKTVRIITNGSMKEIALKLLKMHKERKIAASLSLDQYHDPIDPQVAKAYTDAYALMYNYQKIPDHALLRKGRAANLMKAADECCCERITFVQPTGEVYVCGCQKLHLGHIATGFYLPLQNGHIYRCEKDIPDAELENIRHQVYVASIHKSKIAS